MGVWPTLSGKVRLDGADVAQWDKAHLGPYVGYLPQDVALFAGTIRENIARFAEPDQAKVEAAAERVGLHEFICSLPKGYDTEVGDEGIYLSGGQRQRIGLARAIYGDPRLVVLDEPNASLDEQGEQNLRNCLLALKARGTTVVLITHRPSLLEISDAILILQAGQVAGFGPRDKVLAALSGKAQQATVPARPSSPALAQ
jgi:ATP-binding cassette subfamily C exporter for protease/lipase